jgi:hypothetical protein
MTVKQPSPPGRRRLVPCKKHKLHYDPSLHSGCVLCRKENPLGEKREERPILAWIALLLVFAAGGWYLANRQPDLEVTGGRPALIDPEPYRAQIQTLDDLLFQGDLIAPHDAERSAVAAQALAAMLRRRAANRPDEQGRIDPLDALAESAAQDAEALPPLLTASGEQGAETSAARTAWVALREKVFGRHDWFRTTISAATAPSPAVTPAAVIADLEEFADQFDQVVQTARGELASFDGTPLDDAKVKRWAEWSAAWGERVVTLAGELPPPPGSNADLAAQLAHTELDAALAAAPALGRAAFVGDVPDAARRERALQAIEAALAQARSYLAQARTSAGP